MGEEEKRKVESTRKRKVSQRPNDNLRCPVQLNLTLFLSTTDPRVSLPHVLRHRLLAAKLFTTVFCYSRYNGVSKGEPTAPIDDKDTKNKKTKGIQVLSGTEEGAVSRESKMKQPSHEAK